MATNGNGLGIELKLKNFKVRLSKIKVHVNKITHPWVEKLDFLRMYLRIMSCLSKWETIEFNLTLFVGGFTTFIRCGAWNLQVGLKVDSKERKVGHKGEFGEDVQVLEVGEIKDTFDNSS